VDRVALAGPPWRLVPEPKSLEDDPPVLVECESWTAASPSLGRVETSLLGPAGAAFKAVKLAAEGDGTALVFRGKIKRRSGEWLYVRPQSVVRLDKAPNPMNRREFARMVDRIHRQLMKGATAAEGRALRKLRKVLNADWVTFSAAVTEAEIAAVSVTIAAIARNRGLTVAVTGPLTEQGLKVAAAARGSARRAAVKPFLDLPDQAAVSRIGKDQLFWIQNDYHKRAARWATDANKIIKAGIADGLDSKSVGIQLYDALGKRVSGRSEAYYRMVANVAMTKARSYGQVSGFRDGGFQEYEWTAAMDEATCPICVFLNGQKFPVSEAVDRFARADAAPDADAALADMQFYRVRGDVISVRGSDTPVARFTQERGELPTNFQTITPAQSTEGMQVPPAHEGCRCTLLPVL